MDIQEILAIQRDAWKKGHDNYGTELDVLAAAHHFLKRFQYLNPAQAKALRSLEKVDNLKYAKKLCSRAHKATRYMVVKLK